MSLRKVKHPVKVAEGYEIEKKNSASSSEELIAKSTDEQKENKASNDTLLKVESKLNLPKEGEQANTMQLNQVKLVQPVQQIHLPIVNNELTSAGNGGNCSIFFNANAYDFEENKWYHATISKLKEVAPVQIKSGSCRRVETGLFIHELQRNLKNYFLILSYPNSVIMQLIDACIQPNENRSHFDLLNLVNRQVLIRIEKTEKDNRSYFNVVEVKPLKNN